MFRSTDPCLLSCTLLSPSLSDQALNDMCIVPERKVDAPMRVPISGAYKIKGVGDVLAGRVEQGVVKPGDEVIFLPTHTTANPCVGKVRSSVRFFGLSLLLFGVCVCAIPAMPAARAATCHHQPARADDATACLLSRSPPAAVTHTSTRCSPWRCTTSVWRRPAPVTTWA